MTIIRPKLMIIGHARHGKDTVGDWFKTKGYTFVSSSRFVMEKAVWPEFKHRAGRKPSPTETHLLPFTYSAWPDYFDQEECFKDRDKFRAFWFDCIADYNRPDRSRLGRELFAEYDMYVGLRNWQELEALRLQKAFDLAIWIDASERCPPEPETSMTITRHQTDVVVDNNGTLNDLDKGLEVLYDKWIKPLEKHDWTSNKLDPVELVFEGPIDEKQTCVFQVGKSQLRPDDIIIFNESNEAAFVTRIGAYLQYDNTTPIELTREAWCTKALPLIDTRVHASIIGTIKK